MKKGTWHWPLTLLLGTVVGCILVLCRANVATPQPGRPPFTNSVQQRNEMIQELRDIKNLLREQNKLLQPSHRVEKANSANPDKLE